ncbi:nuclear transport factor 2 family protein [Streptosporangium saharense]|uniref:nuclear transport factor 2 family protein n=1 Tax=Streptosporangium saharense TaxID=1706840 RepID=UPI00332D1940
MPGRDLRRLDVGRQHMLTGCPDLEVVTEHGVENGEWVANRYTHTGERSATADPSNTGPSPDPCRPVPKSGL